MDELQSAKAGLVYDDRYLQHNPGLLKLPATGEPLPFVDPVLHRSNHRVVQRTKHLINLCGLGEDLVNIDPVPASIDDITTYHSEEYVERVIEICRQGGGETGEGAPAGRDSFEVAMLAAGGAMAAVNAVYAGTARRVFGLIRPPGHHAMRDKGIGFCIFNNVVVAANHAREQHRAERIAILDWDVHDGNGTQDAFYDDPNVLFISIHQDRLFPPEFGALDQDGEGDGKGYTVNLPLPAGGGDALYLAACEEIILPVLDEFQPDLILISAGQDASTMDPLGRMCLTTEGYRRMTSLMINRAERHAGGRLVALQEGGYSEIYAPYCGLAIVETLAGRESGLPEPLAYDRIRAQPHYADINTSGREALDSIREHHAQYWNSLQ